MTLYLWPWFWVLQPVAIILAIFLHPSLIVLPEIIVGLIVLWASVIHPYIHIVNRRT